MYNIQDAQLSQRDRAAGCVIVFAKSGRLELGDNGRRRNISLASAFWQMQDDAIRQAGKNAVTIVQSTDNESLHAVAR